MAGKISTDVKEKKRLMLNTTINREILTDFRAYCKETGMPMNMILEAFMAQFANGEFALKIGKANKLQVDFADDEESTEEK